MSDAGCVETVKGPPAACREAELVEVIGIGFFLGGHGDAVRLLSGAL